MKHCEGRKQAGRKGEKEGGKYIEFKGEREVCGKRGMEGEGKRERERER